MSANTFLSVSELDYDLLVADLVRFYRSRPEFADFDFEDSAIRTLIAGLAYNTHKLAFIANMSVNEAYLDTAQNIDNVISRAKALGYTPRSAQGPEANVLVQFTSARANTSFRSITIAKGTAFRSTINGASYSFVTPTSYTISPNTSNLFEGYITLREGIPLTHRFGYTTSNTSFILPNANTDTRSLTVTVASSSNTETYTEASDITTVNSTSKIYYLDADRNGLYKLSFGDNVLGKRPDYDSTVTVETLICSGLRARGANSFTASADIGGETSFTLRTIERARAYGADQETIEEIRFNAPRLYETQNRAVTKEDHKRIVMRDNPDLSTVNVWGGEEHDPPIYGKVYLAVKPRLGTLISTNRKTQLRTSLREYMVQSIDVEVIDPTFMYVSPAVTVRYETRNTTLTAAQIGTLVAEGIVTYELENLNNFEGRFRFSKFLREIDSVSKSIVGSETTVRLEKRFIPSLSARNTYSLRYNSELVRGTLSSSSFSYQDQTCFFDDDEDGGVRLYYLVGASRVYLSLEAGTIDYEEGLVTLSSFLPVSVTNTELSIFAEPESFNIVPVRNQILLISSASIVVVNDVTGNVDARITSVATLGTTESLASSTSVSTVNV